jgi:hypothetical protein
VCPTSDFFDLFFHGGGEWDRGTEDYEQVVFGERLIPVEGFVHRGNNNLFDFTAGPALGNLGQLGDIEAR